MTWVGVDQGVLGDRLSMLQLRLGITRDQALGLVVGLWLWAMDRADASGKILGLNRWGLLKVLAIGSGDTVQLDEAMEALFEFDWVRETSEGDIVITGWSQQQKYHAGDPGPVQMSLLDSVGQPLEEIEKKKRGEYPENFEVIWKAYPRRVEKVRAYKAYCARMKEGFAQEDLLRAAENYAADCKLKHTEQQYIKHPATFYGPTVPFMDWVKVESAVGNIIEEQRRRGPDYNPYD